MVAVCVSSVDLEGHCGSPLDRWEDRGWEGEAELILGSREATDVAEVMLEPVDLNPAPVPSLSQPRSPSPKPHAEGQTRAPAKTAQAQVWRPGQSSYCSRGGCGSASGLCLTRPRKAAQAGSPSNGWAPITNPLLPFQSPSTPFAPAVRFKGPLPAAEAWSPGACPALPIGGRVGRQGQGSGASNESSVCWLHAGREWTELSKVARSPRPASCLSLV